MTQKQAEQLVVEFYDRVDGGYCASCTMGAIQSVLEIYPELRKTMLDKFKEIREF